MSLFALNLYAEHDVWISAPFGVQMGIDENKACDKDTSKQKKNVPKKIEKKTFTRMCRSSFRFLLALIRVYARYFIASTNLSPNFIKPKNGFSLCNTVCLQ